MTAPSSADQSLPRSGQGWLLAGLLLLIALAWFELWRLGQAMAASDGMLAMAMMGMPMPWQLTDAVLMLAMWTVMMAAMMLPSALPMLLLYRLMLRRQGDARQTLALALFASAYLLVWSGFALLATLLQWQLDSLALLTPELRSNSTGLAAALLFGAGLYQWLPLKQACLRHCQGPVLFLVGHWRPGPSGAWRMGLHHGLYCLGCCWALMALLFVVGLMNLLWVAVLTAYVLLEKLLPAGPWLARGAGLLLMGWGLLVLWH
ncbi:hypothetical protein A9179_14845 [Pseudomonas alcaligenes]|uniref:DUF2182 domain-containing protein n=1 Tax=Aquipseudomonas alcaligenes TaxID=43263 RepID=A0ABR7S1V2_AQUAC|nr:DUF2182 domain-containing protein [Pseudomonas alcaligenes]MBC9251547.1 hypothetical protein [Pseudomonas alcaligenes]